MRLGISGQAMLLGFGGLCYTEQAVQKRVEQGSNFYRGRDVLVVRWGHGRNCWRSYTKFFNSLQGGLY